MHWQLVWTEQQAEVRRVREMKKKCEIPGYSYASAWTLKSVGLFECGASMKTRKYDGMCIMHKSSVVATSFNEGQNRNEGS